MAAAENSKGILYIPVDDSEFVAFLGKFENYREQVKNGEAGFGGAAQDFRNAADSATELNAEIARIVQAVNNSKMTGPSSFIQIFTKDTHIAMGDWKQIEKSTENTNKSFKSLARTWFSTTPLRTGALGFLGAATGIAGAAASAANSLANDNRRNRELGLKPGEVPAFNNDFKKFGLSDADIENTVSAQNDSNKWKAFSAAGLKPEQFQTMDPAELTAYMSKWAGAKVREWTAQGLPVNQLSKAWGLTDLGFSQNQLRLAGTYSDEQHDEAVKQFRADIPRFAVDQKTEDEATEQQRQWNNVWSGVKRDFEKSFMTLTPVITKAATAFSNAADAFSRSPEIKEDLNELASDLDDVLKFVRFAKKVNDDPANNPDAEYAGDVHQFGLNVWNGVKQSYRDIYSYFNGAPPPRVSMDDSTPSEPGKYSQWTKPASQRFGLPAGLQDLQIRVESRGNPNAVNPKTGATGLMQFMPDTARQMHIDPLDPQASIWAGASLLHQLTKIYGTLGKGLAAYNGDTHISADEKRNRSWLMGAKDETLNYLRVFRDKGYDLGFSDFENDYLTKHSKPWQDAKNDAKLKKKPEGLDEGQFQIVDLSKDGRPLTQQQTASAVEMGVVSGMSKFMSLFKEGGGSQFRMPDTKREKPSDGARAPVRVDVHVNTPAGSSTNVAINSLPH